MAMLVGIVACLHLQHRRLMAERQNAMTWADVLPKIQAAVPDAAVSVCPIRKVRDRSNQLRAIVWDLCCGHRRLPIIIVASPGQRTYC